MTYCVAMLLNEGLVALADTRTHAGVDQIASFPKLHAWEQPGERLVMLMNAGNLAISQSVVNLLQEGVGKDHLTLDTAPTLFAAARLVGAAVREVHDYDAEAMHRQGTDFNASFILAGQIAGHRLRLFMIYSAGNFIEASTETPYFQIGETKYGKPIIDRVIRPETPLVEAGKCALISMDSTLWSNLSVGLPIDLAIYRRDALKLGLKRRFDGDGPYFRDIRRRWSEGLRSVFSNIPNPDWTI
jgi:putative proteasome-type protease